MNDIRFIDMFGGVGGFRLGLEKVSKAKSDTPCIRRELLQGNKQPKKSFTCVGYYEIDKYAVQTYNKNFGENHKPTDVRDIKWSKEPGFDMLCAGFPCQSFSIAGKRRGFDDTRGTLFFEIARAIREKQPCLLFLENVKGLLSHDKGKTFATILSTLDEMGYDAQWQVLNSKNFGVPQNRERVFIVGHIRGKSRPEVFLIQKISTGVIEQLNQPIHSTNRLYSPKGISRTIKSRAGGKGAKTGLYAIPVLTPNRAEKRQDGRRFKENGEPMFTLTRQDTHGVYDGMRIRRLTPKECERLQGFPDNWTEGVSDTQRYKQMGNAVTVNVIQAIGEKILGVWE